MIEVPVTGEWSVKIFCAAVGTETNTFSPLPTGWATYRELLYHRRGRYRHARLQHFFVIPVRVWKKVRLSTATLSKPPFRPTR